MTNMNIVFTSDDNFVRQTAAAMVSVFENNKKERVVVYLLSKGITDENKRVLESMANAYGQTLSVSEIGDVHQYFEEKIDTGGWNDIVLARLFLDKILPDEVERVLYLDGDVIIRHSLKDLWETDLKGNVLGMVMEPTTKKERKELLGIPRNGNYYNAGVLLIDLKQWKEKQVGKRIVSYFKEHGSHLFANDQDAINGELKDEIYPLDLIYNYCNTYYFYPYRAIKKMVGRDDYYDKDTYIRMINDPVIVHYLGEERPWREGNKHVFKDDFVKYYRLTEYAKRDGRDDGVLETGWKKYFFVWNLFNQVMRPFPMLRLSIINALIPTVMKIRKKKK